ncbi:iron-siderophore ABC transporter substrate-binding protein [Streptomyces sp. NPDC093252]|uniref:iron-siderophore ABC transporter substrate-binding protein n=1 Tax=Streptomyces sp. NPDC093252 TaxID=3154980 RepID=UPI00341D62C8
MAFAASPFRRRNLAVAGSLALALFMTGCGGSDDTAGDEGGSGDAGAAAGAFPVTIDSALGEATIESAPQRIVTLGQGSAETAIALGTVPVGVEDYPWGSDDTGYLPWVHAAITERGADLPKEFTGGEELDIEAITELEPDLILAPWSGVTQDQFDILKDIAPTVAYPEEAWSTNWDQQIEIIAEAMGRPDQAQVLIDDIDEQLADAAASRPQYKDVTFSYIYNSGPGTLGIFKPQEQRVAMVSKLGLKVDPVVDGFEETPGTDSAVMGLENADKLSGSDVLFTFYSDAKTREEVEAQPLYGAIPAVRNQALVFSNDQPFVTASSIINPLTVPYTIDRYLPMIDKAVARVEK